MVLKHFKYQVILRTILLAISIFIFLYLLQKTEINASILIIALIIIYQVYGLIKLMNRTNQKLTQFLEAIRYADFSQSFRDDSLGGTFKPLNQTFAEVIADFQRIRGEKEESLRYLQTIVQHIGIALLVYDQKGKIQLINNAAKKLLNVRQIAHVQSLKNFSEKIVQLLMTMKPRTRHLLKVQISENLLHLVIYTTEFRLRNQTLTIASIQNIQSELEEKEMEAWQKLIRVLTHEIMNSITPISSLAKTVDELLMHQSKNENKQIDDQEFIDIRDAVNTIQKRSEGLIHFVEAYRKLTRIPKPDLKQIDLKDTIHQVTRLMDREFQDQNILVHMEHSQATLTIFADPEQIEQVLINLIKNSIDALAKKKEKRIRIKTVLDEQGRKVIEITDNGSGIAAEAREHIFVPFYTTKKTGSGIGLSLCRQIMRQHLGSISAYSEPMKNTTFKLLFP